jgi:hypothetical protein
MFFYRPIALILFTVISLIFQSNKATDENVDRSVNYVWWEAEKPDKTDIIPLDHKPENLQEVASGGNWLTNKSGSFVEYEIQVPYEGEWMLYARVFWKHTSFRWRFDKDPWKYILRFGYRGLRLPSRWLKTDEDWIKAEDRISEALLLDNTQVGNGYSLNWIPLGSVRLSAGSHTFSIELDKLENVTVDNPDGTASEMALEMAESQNLAIFDAFVLTQQKFYPRGKAKPDEQLPEKSGWWCFIPGQIENNKKALNLATLLNEPFAGSKGFIGLENESFIYSETGEPVRFWGVHVQSSEMPPEMIEEQAQFFAHHGINLIRIYPFHWRNRGAKSLEIDPVKVRRFQRLVQIFKQQGIYIMIGIYSGRAIYDLEYVKGFESFKTGQVPWLLHAFHPKFQEYYYNWLQGLLTAENPYTGVPLAEEPAILGIELQNEANVFWWTFQGKNLPSEIWDIVEKSYYKWLVQKYGTLEAAIKAWTETNADSINRDRLMLEPWNLVSKPSQRIIDQINFCAELEKSFYVEAKKYLKETIGYKGLVLTGNWETIADVVLGPVLAWSESPSDFHDHHFYFHSPNRQEEINGKNVSFFQNISALKLQEGQSNRDAIICGFMDIIRDGKPSMTSEFSWLGKNRFRSEYPLFVASQSRSGGMDAMIDFSAAPIPGWAGNDVDWTRQNPAVFGQYPAAAILFRNEVLKEGEVLVHMRMNEKDALNLRSKQLITKSVRRNDYGYAETKNNVKEKEVLENRNIYLSAGKIKMDIGEFMSTNKIEDLNPFWDKQDKIIHHSNGQIDWDYGLGVYTVNAPGANAVIGFLKETSPVTLSAMKLDTDIPFGAVCLVSLDEKPIPESHQALLQIMTEQKEYNEKHSEPDAEGWINLLQTGSSPYLVRDIKGTIELLWDGSENCRVVPLDPDFSVRGESRTGKFIELERTTMYYLIEQ